MTQAEIDKRFTFDENEHLYTLDGKPITGVTTIIAVIGKPKLIQWAADMAVGQLGWYDERYIENTEQAKKLLLEQFERIKKMTLEEFFQHLSMARTYHAKKKVAAGNIGTKAHKWIEQSVKSMIHDTEAPDYPSPEVKPIADSFSKWVLENNAQFLESEIRVFSEKYWYAGTCDIILKIDGKLWIGDIKTSSGIYPENFFQTAAYQNAVVEMGLYPDAFEGNIILNCRKDGTFEEKRSYGYEGNLRAFIAATHIYRALEELKIVA